jgi:hypothetical protein
MSKAWALCTDAQPFQSNRIFDRSNAQRYPGAMWAPYLRELGASLGVEVVTGDVALDSIRAGRSKPQDYVLIQEDAAVHGEQLRQMGARAGILFSLESPMFAGRFYAHLARYSRPFACLVLFSGAEGWAAPGSAHERVYFPSFEPGAPVRHVPWSERKFLVMVAGNKYFRETPPRGLWALLRRSARALTKWKRRSLSAFVATRQLHDERLRAIEHFGSQDALDLFGPGWSNLDNLPSVWRSRLGPIIARRCPTAAQDKIETISGYKFSICFENMDFAGYVTEKIIDCFRANVIPIYLGSREITEYVPEGAFLDYRAFPDLAALEREIRGMSEPEAARILECGQAFLRSEAGLKFSYRSFAERMVRHLHG